jgi:hypothetical protein
MISLLPCILNACPLCKLWFSCRNYLTTSCRHTYHPSCMVEHAKVSSNCVIPFCEVVFIANWCTTCGFGREPKDVQIMVNMKSKRLQTFKMPTNTSSFSSMKHNLSSCILGFTCYYTFPSSIFWDVLESVKKFNL